MIFLFKHVCINHPRFLENKEMGTMVEEHNQKIASTGRDETMEYWLVFSSWKLQWKGKRIENIRNDNVSEKTSKFRIWIWNLQKDTQIQNLNLYALFSQYKFKFWICITKFRTQIQNLNLSLFGCSTIYGFLFKKLKLAISEISSVCGEIWNKKKKYILTTCKACIYLIQNTSHYFVILFFFQKPQLTLTVVQSTHPLSLGGSDWNNSITTQLAGGPEKKWTSQCWLAMLAAHQAFGLHIHIRMVAFEGYISLAMLATHLKMVSLVGCLWRLHLNSHVGYTFEKGQPGRLPLKATFGELCWLHIWKGSAL